MSVCNMLLVLAISLSMAVNQVASCPVSCSCIYNRDKLAFAIDCSGKGLTEVPTTGVDMNTYSLDMSWNQLRQIPTDLLITYPNVTEFNFENNNIEAIPASAFSGFKLRRLKLNGNSIQEVATESFGEIHGQCNLEDFTLTGGAFAYANHYDWFVKNLEEVEWPCAIDLRNNPISNVEQGAFTASNNFTLYLGHSDVDMTIQPHAFANVEYILGVFMVRTPTLKLSKLSFGSMGTVGWVVIDGTETSLPKQLFSRTHPRMVRVSNSNILQMDPLDITMAVKQRCEIRTDVTLSLHAGGIEMINNTLPVLPARLIWDARIAGIYFQGNRIAGLEKHVFERKELRIAQPICTIRFDDNDFEVIPGYTFQRMNNVKRVSIVTNSLKTIEENAFSGISDIGLIYLYFKDNDGIRQIRIKAHAFSGRQINSLEIVQQRSNNSQLVIEPQAFSKINYLGNMRIETFGSNKSMRILPNDLFTGLDVKGTLALDIHNITRIQAKAFGGEGESSIHVLRVAGFHSIPCDCETAKLYLNIQSNIQRSVISCYTRNEDGSWRIWPLSHATCSATRISLSLILMAFLAIFTNL